MIPLSSYLKNIYLFGAENKFHLKNTAFWDVMPRGSCGFGFK
jgi:hypothetical protein